MSVDRGQCPPLHHAVNKVFTVSIYQYLQPLSVRFYGLYVSVYQTVNKMFTVSISIVIYGLSISIYSLYVSVYQAVNKVSNDSMVSVIQYPWSLSNSIYGLY